MEFQINREHATERGQLRQEAVSLLAKAALTDEPRANAAMALLTLWTIAEDEVHFGEMVESAMTLTEDDHDELLEFAKAGEFHVAARWLVG